MSKYVARCLEIVDASGLDYRLNPMGTVVEGPFDEVLALIARCHQAVAKDCDRVSTTIRPRMASRAWSRSMEES